MSMKTTSEMEIHIRDLYEKLKPFAEKEGIFKPITFHFAETTPHNYPGDFCYSDGKYYYYGSIGDRGEVIIEKTSSLFEVAYYIFYYQTSVMAFDYEKKNRVDGQPLRQIAFKKIVELMGIIGTDFKDKAKFEINKILKEHPFEDSDVPLQSSIHEVTNKPTYTLKSNESRFENKYISETLMDDILHRFTPAYWNFMTLIPSLTIKGSSFIQVGSPDAKTNNKMAVEIGFPSSKGIELYRYYTDNKAEVLRIFWDYYEKQALPNYKNWENVSTELKQSEERRFL